MGRKTLPVYNDLGRRCLQTRQADLDARYPHAQHRRLLQDVRPPQRLSRWRHRFLPVLHSFLLYDAEISETARAAADGRKKINLREVIIHVPEKIQCDEF